MVLYEADNGAESRQHVRARLDVGPQVESGSRVDVEPQLSPRFGAVKPLWLGIQLLAGLPIRLLPVGEGS